MRAVVTVAAVELRRFLRDRSNIFFVFLFPLLLVVVIGAQFGSNAQQGHVTVAGPESVLRAALAEELHDEGVSVVLTEDPDPVREQLARGRTDVGLFVPGPAAEAFDATGELRLEIVTAAQQTAQLTAQHVRTAARAVSVDRGQVAALADAGVADQDAERLLADAAASLTAPTVQVVDAGRLAEEFSGLGQFDLGAAGQTLVFVFLISAAGSATLIQARRRGVINRILAAPLSTAQALGGQALGRFVIAMFQGAYIMLATAVLFDVDWGSVWLSLLVVATFSVVAAGAAMLLGSLLDNDAAANGVGVGLGLVLAALGGCMMPLELFPDTLRTVAHVTPHAWAYEALAEIQRQDAGLVDVLPQLGVLAAMAVALLVLGTWALRRSTARAM